MRFLAEPAPGSHPTFDLGCGSLCNVNYDSLLSSAIAIAVTLAVGFVIAARLRGGRPGRLQTLFEFALDYIRGMVRSSVHEDATFIVPIAMTIGFYILVANYLDFLPLGIFPNIHPANEDLNQTLAMSLVVILVVQAYSIRVLGFGGYLRRFTRPFDLPVWARVLFIPLNIVEEVVKPITLAARLFFNIFAGGVMVFLITLLLGHLASPFGPVFLAPLVLAAWKLFDVLFIGAIQAFIFMLLTIIYFGMAREGLEEHH